MSTVRVATDVQLWRCSFGDRELFLTLLGPKGGDQVVELRGDAAKLVTVLQDCVRWIERELGGRQQVEPAALAKARKLLDQVR